MTGHTTVGQCWSLVWCWLVVLSPALAAEWIDLSHTYDNTTNYWPGNLHFNLTAVYKGLQPGGFWLAAHNFETSEHGGTHMDAPSHFIQNGLTVDEIPVERFIAHAALVDISERAQADPDTTLTSADLENWKQEHGSMKYPTILLIRTGNAAHWNNKTRYWGVNSTEDWENHGWSALHFPGIGEDAARTLAADRAVVGVGLDTPSLDPGTSTQYPAHQILFRAGIFGLEHVADMSRVPATGATILAIPMKIGGGSGGPTRVLVRLP